MTLHLDEVNYHKSVIHQTAGATTAAPPLPPSLSATAAADNAKSNAEETSVGISGTVYEKNPSNKNCKQSLVNTNDLFRLATEATPIYIKNPLFNQKTSAAAAPGIASRLATNVSYSYHLFFNFQNKFKIF